MERQRTALPAAIPLPGQRAAARIPAYKVKYYSRLNRRVNEICRRVDAISKVKINEVENGT